MNRLSSNEKLARNIRMIELSNIIEKIPEELMNQSVFDEMNNLCPDLQMVNQKVADYHNISLQELIASPNMNLLTAQWYAHLRDVSIGMMMKTGMTKVQAEALFEYGILLSQEQE